MTTILLWAVFIAFFLLVVLAPIVRWFARRGPGAEAPGRARRMPPE